MTKYLKSFYMLLVYGMLYLPIAIVIIYSFNHSRFSLLWHGFTFHWYHVLWHDPDIWLVTWHSLLIGILASTVSALLGTLAATSLIRYRFLGRKFLYGTIVILTIVPNIVMGISLLLLYVSAGLPLGFWSLLFAHIIFCMPFVAILVYSRMRNLDKNIFEAAQDLGASDYIIFKRIVVPLMWPAVIAGWLLSFTMSLDDVTVSYFVTGPGFEILPLKIYSMVRLGVKPEVNALSTILFVFTLLVVIVSQRILRKTTRLEE